MSELFLGCFIRGDESVVLEFLANDRLVDSLGVATFSDVLSVVFVRQLRSCTIPDNEIDRLARSLSTRFSDALIVDYDSRLGYRQTRIYASGELRRSFDKDDELWVPLDESGEPMKEAPALKCADLLEDEEYETIRDAIDLGFEAFQSGNRAEFKAFIPKI